MLRSQPQLLVTVSTRERGRESVDLLPNQPGDPPDVVALGVERCQLSVGSSNRLGHQRLPQPADRANIRGNVPGPTGAVNEDLPTTPRRAIANVAESGLVMMHLRSSRHRVLLLSAVAVSLLLGPAGIGVAAVSSASKGKPNGRPTL